MSARCAVVTGAARGIGAATVLELARAGVSVIAVDRGADDPRLPYAMGTAAELHVVADLAAASGDGAGTVIPFLGDACDRATMQEAVALAEERFGGLDAVVAVAGVVAGGVPLWEMDAGELRAVLEVDLESVILAAQVGIPALLRRPEPRAGRFVAVSSTAATRGLPLLAAYCAAKAGVEGLIRALAMELRGTGVTANAVSPGSTDTAILVESARLYGLESGQHFAAQQPIERLIQPAEVAAHIAWLAGPGSGGVSGASHAVDGGLSA